MHACMHEGQRQPCNPLSLAAAAACKWHCATLLAAPQRVGPSHHIRSRTPRHVPSQAGAWTTFWTCHATMRRKAAFSDACGPSMMHARMLRLSSAAHHTALHSLATRWVCVRACVHANQQPARGGQEWQAFLTPSWQCAPHAPACMQHSAPRTKPPTARQRRAVRPVLQGLY